MIRQSAGLAHVLLTLIEAGGDVRLTMIGLTVVAMHSRDDNA